MRNAKNYFADTSFLVDIIQGRYGALQRLRDSEHVVTGSICIYELKKKVNFNAASISEAVIVPFEVEDAERASEFYRKTTRKGIELNNVEYLGGAQAAKIGKPILTTDQAFRKIEGLETLYYRDY